MKEVFLEKSILSVSDNCDKGHCGCFYTNGNRCCRCGKYQFVGKEYVPRVVYKDRPYRKNKKKDVEVMWVGEAPPDEIN